MTRILKRTGEQNLYVTLPGGDAGQECHKEAQAKDQNAPGQKPQKRTARGEYGRDTCQSGEGEVDDAHLAVTGRVGCDPLVDVLPMGGEDVLARRSPPRQGVRR